MERAGGGGREVGSCLDHSMDCYGHSHAQSASFLPTLGLILIDGTHCIGGRGGVDLKYTHAHTQTTTVLC